MKRIANIFVSIVFLIAIIGIQVNTHYSKGKLYSIGIFQEAKSCCEIEHTCHLEKESQTNQTKTQNNSCENLSTFFQIDDVFASEQLSLPKVKLLELFVIIAWYTSPDLTVTALNQWVSYYSPPILNYDNPQAFSGVFLC
jgi:hypothetical protein